MKAHLPKVVVLLVFVSSAHAAGDMTKTNSDFALEVKALALDIELPPETNGLWNLAVSKMWQNRISVDRMGPFALQGITFSQFQGYGVWKYNVSLGRGVMVDTLLDAFRDSAGETVPYEDWLDSWDGHTNDFFGRIIVHPMASFFAGLIDGSVGNTAEEELKFGSPTTSEIALSRWRQIKNQYDLKYGIHGNYGYLNAKLGSVCYVDTRLEASLPGVNTSALTRILRLSGQLVFPIDEHKRIIVGGALYPEEYVYSTGFDHANYGPSFATRYEEDVIVHGKYLGSGAIGYNEDAHGRLFAFQYVYNF